MQILLNLVLSIIIIALIFHLAGIGKVFAVLAGASPGYLLLALLSYLCLNIVMSFRIKKVLQSLGESLALRQILPSNLAGLLASDFTPARSGYFFTAFSLSSKSGIRLDKTMMAIFGPQIFDFLIKASSAGILIFLLMGRAGIGNLLINAAVLAFIFAGIIGAGALVFHPPLLERLSPLRRLPLMPRLFGFIGRMHEHSDKVMAVKWTVVWITLLSWAIKGMEWLFLAKALGIGFFGDFLSDFLFMMVFQGAVTIIQFLPIPTLAGAGASEAGFAAILLSFGVSVESGIAFAFMTRILMIAVDILSLPVIFGYLHTHSLEKSLESLSELRH